MCIVSTLCSVEQLNDPYTCVRSPGHVLGTVLDTGHTAMCKTKVVQVLEELACQWDGVDRTTMGTRTLYVNQREGRWYSEKNRIDSEESFKRQTWKHTFCSGFLIIESRRVLSFAARRPLEIHDRASEPSDSPPPN